ncbi:MAG: tetratricopeptide repeat-containing sensor histidine kinase [Sediminicola sp.]
MAHGSPIKESTKKIGRAVLFFLLSNLFSVVSLIAQQPVKEQLYRKLGQRERQEGSLAKDTAYINLLNKLGYQLLYTNRDSVQLLSTRALELSKNLGYRYGEAHALINLGSNGIFMGNVSEGLEHAGNAIKIAKEISKNDLMLKALNLKGICYFYDGAYIEAYKTYMEGIGIAHQMSDHQNEFKISMNLGTLYSILKDYDNAIKYYDKALKLAKGLNDVVGIARTRSNLGYLHSNTGEYYKAMAYIEEAIATFEEKGISEWLAFSYITKGGIYLKQGEHGRALEYYKKSQKIHEGLQDKKGKSDVLRGLAEANFGLGKTDTALGLAKESLAIAESIRFMAGVERSSNLLYKIYKKKNDHGVALHHLEVARKISDSLSVTDKKVSLMMYGEKMGFEESRRKIDSENQATLSSQKRYIYIFLLGIVGLTVIVVLLRRSTIVERKLNKELQEREKELREINDTKNKLFSIIGHDLKGPMNNLNQLLKLYVDKHISEAEFAQFAPKLQKDVDNIHFTLNNLLSWGKTQMQGATIDPVDVNVHKVAEENIMLLKDMATNKNIEIKNLLSEKDIVWADAQHLGIVLRNLISNAIKFTQDNGKITISSKREGETLTVAVADTGVGMDLKTQQRIFDGTGTFTTYGTHNEKGTGLGLALCQEILKKNKGGIQVQSSLGKGTIFSFSLPSDRKIT